MEGGIHSAFFELLRSGLWARVPDPIIFRTLTDNDWKGLYEFAILQTVEGVIWDGLQLLDEDLLPSKDLLMKWTVRQERIEQRNIWMNTILVEQISTFKAYGLSPILQKGQGVAQYYERPLSRRCGDIDWYFEHKEEYKKAAQLMVEFGKKIQYEHGYSLFYRWKNCDIEHHQHLTDLRSPFIAKTLKGLADPLNYPYDNLDINNVSVRIPHPIQNAVLVNAHILKHLIGYGIGIRQLCDSARLYHCLNTRLEGDKIYNIYKELGMLKWIYVLHGLLTKYIGLDEKKLPFEQPEGVKADWVMADILKGGNFGFYNSLKSDRNKLLGKIQRRMKIFDHFFKYVGLAPLETLSFPFILLFTKIRR